MIVVASWSVAWMAVTGRCAQMFLCPFRYKKETSNVTRATSSPFIYYMLLVTEAGPCLLLLLTLMVSVLGEISCHNYRDVAVYHASIYFWDGTCSAFSAATFACHGIPFPPDRAVRVFPGHCLAAVALRIRLIGALSSRLPQPQSNCRLFWKLFRQG